MAKFQPSVARWAPVVDAELARAQCPLPRDLILAVIHVESRGKAGTVNPKSGASGLMQVMPGTLDDYNKGHPFVALEELRSSAPASAVKQIRVGLSVLSAYWKSAYRYLSSRLQSVPIDELSRIADLFYVAGPGATRRRLDKLPLPTYDNVRKAYSNWNALPHPENVFSRAGELPWRIEEIKDWVGKGTPLLEDPKTGLAIALAGLLVTWFLMKKYQ